MADDDAQGSGPGSRGASGMMASLAVILAGVTALYVLIAGALWLAQERLLFLPDRDLADTPARLGMAYEDLALDSADGVRLHGWYLPHPEARGALLFLHGNAGDIGDRVTTLAVLQRLRLDLLIIDYRGYGLSTGRADEAGIHRDARAAWDELRRRGHPAERIVVHGRSLGGAVAARLAAEVRPAGLILEATFTSLADLAAGLYPWLPARHLLRMRFATADAATRYVGPVLVAHATADEIVPYRHAEVLLARLGARGELLIMDGGHNDGFLASETRYASALERFVDRALAP